MAKLKKSNDENSVRYYPLTNSQKRIWYIEKLHPGTSIGNIATTLKIKEKVDYPLFEQALNIVISNNDALRFRFLERDGHPYQYISNYEYLKMDLFDFTENGLDQLYSWDQEETRKPFTIIDSCLTYFSIIKITENEYWIYSKIHHLIADAWTIVCLANKVFETYTMLKEGLVISQEKDPSYLEYVINEEEYLNSPKFLKDKEYWENIFTNAPEITTLKSKTTKLNYTTSVRKTFRVPRKLAKKIAQYCQENKTSVFSLYISALCIYINRVTNKEDIVIGVPVLNRSNFREKKTLGMFISTVPLRINIDYDTNFLGFSHKLTNDWMSILRHQKYPYEEILKHIRKNNKNIEKLYEIAVSYQNAKFAKNEGDKNYEGRWHLCGHQTESLNIHINEREDDGNMIIDYDYLTDLFYSKEIEFIHDHVIRILWHALDNSLKKISQLEMISEKEKQKILYDFNNTSRYYPHEEAIHQSFEDRVEKNPDKTALIFEEKTLTYQELNEKSNQLARLLRQTGVRPDTIVGIMVPRSLEMIVSILAVLKAGGAYLPIDPEYPSQRIEYMLEDSKASILLTNHQFINDIIFNKKIIDVFTENYADIETSNLPNVNKPNDLAYLIYTSGSTGNPKGVMIEHKAVANFIEGVTANIEFSSAKRILSITTISFDIFILESLLPLSKGLTVVIANEKQQIIPEELNKVLLVNDVKMFQTTPSRFQLLLNSDMDMAGLRNLTDILVGGEVLSSSILNNLRKVSQARIYNMYGPTETTVWSTMADVTFETRPHIGKPIANTKIFILDKQLNLLPIGTPGDLYIGGDGVSRGYYEKNDLTEERFINNPFADGEKMYKTGDLASWYPEGDIKYLGRTDFQVKIRGYRIELGEIEDKLLCHPDIIEAVVVVKEYASSKKILCAYFVSMKKISSSEIKAYLNDYLPDYMIPGYIIQIDVIPKTPNNKVDRNALPEFVADNVVDVLPRNSTEKKMARIWCSLLNRKTVGIDDNFFDLGGDSLSIVQLQVRLMKKGINISIQDLYQYQTIRQIADSLFSKNNSVKLETEHNFLIDKINLNYDILPDSKNTINNILLTGVTGFLGIHMLEQLLINMNSDIYCLIRGQETNVVEKKLRDKIDFYFNEKYNLEINKRIKIVIGDITKEDFGLNHNEYESLLKKIDLVIHSAAIVKHFGVYEDFLSVNINGTERIINFCLTGNIRLNYISSISVSGNYLTRNKNKEKVDFSESDLYIGQDYFENVYVRSKFEAENLIYKNVKNGLLVDIYRLGVLTGRYNDGHFQNNIQENGFYERIKSIINLGIIPESWITEQVEFTPVDYCCIAIVKLISLPSGGARVFHLYNHRTISLARIIEILNNVGSKVEIVSNNTFQLQIQRIIKENNVSAALNNMSKGNIFTEESTANIKSEKTISILKELDFEWPEIDDQYILRIVSYMLKVNYINNDQILRNIVC